MRGTCIGAEWHADPSGPQYRMGGTQIRELSCGCAEQKQRRAIGAPPALSVLGPGAAPAFSLSPQQRQRAPEERRGPTQIPTQRQRARDRRALQHGAPSSDPRATHPARSVPFFQERTPNLPIGGKHSNKQRNKQTNKQTEKVTEVFTHNNTSTPRCS